ncbi:MAG: tetratricopeptide repeat protein [Polaromonas sp.]|nr:tetratricopeptide repeat protein [Polaromonas sp.]
MTKLSGWTLGFLLLAGLPACAQTRAQKAGDSLASPAGTDSSQAAVASSALGSQLFYQLLIGEITAQGGEAAAAFALILDAARKTGDADLYKRATEVALRARAGDNALQSALAWKQAAPESREANRYVLQILIVLGRLSEAREPLQTELRLAPAPERSAVLAAVPPAFARASDKKLAAKMVEEALRSTLADPVTAAEAWGAVARLRLAADEIPAALEAAQRAQSADVQSETAALVALELMDAKSSGAETLVRHYLDKSAKPASEIRLGFARALLEAQRYSEATAQLQIIGRERPDFAEAWLVLGSLQLQDNQLVQAQTSLERYVALTVQQDTPGAERNRSLSQAYLALAQVAEKRKDFPAAEGWLDKIENSEELIQAQTRRASILAAQGKLEMGRELIRSLPAKTTAEARQKLIVEVSLLRDAKQYKPAHDLLSSALQAAPDDTDLLYDRAIVSEKLGLLDEMERDLRQVMRLKPDYHHAYNALGYSLAERDVRLPEAKQLIEKALSFAPTDPYIRDSLGWVEFRLGNKAEAAAIFDAAFKARPDAEIAAHYGEVLWSLGQRERAVAIWKEGKLLNPENETLLETLKRLRVSL